MKDLNDIEGNEKVEKAIGEMVVPVQGLIRAFMDAGLDPKSAAIAASSTLATLVATEAFEIGMHVGGVVAQAEAAAEGKGLVLP